MTQSYEAQLQSVKAGSIEEADLVYDAALMKWCFEFNREPSLHGRYLKFSTWDEFDKFAQSIP